jgi:uncharacterized cupredoxin-like copper-binding protein
MAAYYVFGIALVVFALALFAVGQTRTGFPSNVRTGRNLMATAGILVAATFAVLVASTEREHPREEAKAKAAEKGEKTEAGKQLAPGGNQPGHDGGQKPAGGGAVTVVEQEYSVKLPSAKALEPGPYGFEVVNKGKIQHDLAVEGTGVRDKTPLIAPGDSEKLKVELGPGKYKLYCTVPGHEQLGMKTELTVR